MVLLVMAIAAIARRACIRALWNGPADGSGRQDDRVYCATRGKRRSTFNATVTLRMDPKTLKYQIDTSGVRGSGRLAEGTLDMGLTATLLTDQPRLSTCSVRPASAFADTVVVRGGNVPLTVRVDPWSGVARADSL